MYDTDKENLTESLLRLLPVYNHCFQNFANLRSFDLTKTQLRILIILNQRSKITMGNLADSISASKEQTTRAVSPLAEKGYIFRSVNENNRRRLNVELTDKGEELLKKLRKACESQLIEAFEKLSETETAEFLSSLNVIINTLDKISR
ncbi:MAG: MarR family winged helix-turn-helix transcriptional regulator [Porcipelethomonas sp.]